MATSVLLMSGAATALGCPKTSLVDLEDEVMCPVCGTTLAVATEAPQAKRERAFIARQVAKCKSKDQVKEALVAEFGDEILATPSGHGIDLAAWLVPAAAITLAGLALALALRRRGRIADESVSAATEPATGPDDRRRIDAEIEHLDP